MLKMIRVFNIDGDEKLHGLDLCAVSFSLYVCDFFSFFVTEIFKNQM